MGQAKSVQITRLLLIPYNCFCSFLLNSCYTLALLQSLLFKVQHGQQKEPDRRFWSPAVTLLNIAPSEMCWKGCLYPICLDFWLSHQKLLCCAEHILGLCWAPPRVLSHVVTLWAPGDLSLLVKSASEVLAWGTATNSSNWSRMGPHKALLGVRCVGRSCPRGASQEQGEV